MRLAFDDRLIVTNHFDGEMSMLADRHYSRRTVGARQFLYSGRKLVLRDAEGLVLFAWMWPDATMRMDKQEGYNNAIFRNESSRQSSEIVLEAEQFAVRKWGPNRAYTFIDPQKIKSRNPGYCFKVAGWKFCGLIGERETHSGEILMSDLQKYDITTEAWREYDFGGRVYRIESPQSLYVRPSGTTHRVVGGDGVAHCLPAPGSLGCVLRWKNKDTSVPVNF